MRLSEFIRENKEQIVNDWESFALTCLPAQDFPRSEARDDVEGMLNFLIEDLEKLPDEQPLATASCMIETIDDCNTAAHNHAEQRFSKGFDTLEMASEFRALRANITRLWLRELKQSPHTLREMIRMNESIDQMAAESLTRYVERERRGRNLLLGTLVHDIRNPLNAIAQSAQLLEHMGNVEERKEKLITQIRRSTGRIAELVSHLIDSVRLQLGKQLPIQRTSFNLTEVARHVVDELRVVNPDRNITLEAPEKLVGEWDKSRVGQIISNLVGNALKYGEKGTEVVVSISKTPEGAVLSIHNDGNPIPVREIAHIFDPLTRGIGRIEEDPDKLSLGLGLFITREITLAHGGTITVDSTVAEGTAFTVKLPIHAPSSAVH